MRVLITRPYVDALRLQATLKDLGVEAVSAPLLDIEYLEGAEVDLNTVQALVFTSVNGVRAFAKRNPDRELPVLCVGDATAKEAHANHFEDVKSADGDVNSLSALVKAELDPSVGEILHLAGTHVAGDLSKKLSRAGFSYERTVLYTAHKAKALPQSACSALQDQNVDGILFYSPRTAQAFVNLASKAGLENDLNGLVAYCLSPAVGDALNPKQWKDIKIASNPCQDALLKLL